MAESALVFLVPEAEPFADPYRRQFDPNTAIGLPAHITLVYPFVDYPLKPALLEDLSAFFAGHSPLPYRIERVGRFPATVFLMPEPAESIRELIRELVAAFEVVPYGGAFWPRVEPHLTIGNHLDSVAVDELAGQLESGAGSHLPIHCVAREAVLLAKRDGRWHRAEAFPFSSPTEEPAAG